MYEYGLGVPMDLHLAKRFYDEALSSDTQVRQPSARHGRCEVEGVGWAREVAGYSQLKRGRPFA